MNVAALLSLAAELVAGPSEIHWRAAVGRAYLALLHAGSRLLTRAGFHPPLADLVHNEILERLAEAGHAGVVAAAETLSRLRMEEVRADHDANRPFRQPVAQELVLAAIEAVDFLESVREEETLANIGRSIHDAGHD